MSLFDSGSETLVLVIGAPRSGTTLLSGLLSENADAYPMLPECTNITQLIQHYHNFVCYADAQRFSAYAVSPDRLVVPYQQMVDNLIGLALSHFEGNNYRHLVLKDPELSLLVDEIPRFFGKQAKVICIVRDPRAVIASMTKIWQKKRADAWQRFRNAPGWATAGRYLQNFMHAQSLSDVVFNYYWHIHQSVLWQQGRIHVVQYEKIIEGDDCEFARLNSYLGYSCGREGFGKVYLPFDEQDDAFSGNYGKAIRSHRSNFQKTLSKRQLVRIKSAFSGFNEKYRWW